MQLMARRMGCDSQSPELGASLHRVLLQPLRHGLDKLDIRHWTWVAGRKWKWELGYGEGEKCDKCITRLPILTLGTLIQEAFPPNRGP